MNSDSQSESGGGVSSTDLLAALDAITRIGGNLDDDRHTDKTGPNDARQRGLMYCAAREIARKALETHDPNWKPALEWKRAANVALCGSAGREKADASGETQCAPSDSHQQVVGESVKRLTKI